MRARQEFLKWRMSVLPSSISEERAYIAGFNRAVELAQEILKRQGEGNDEIINEKV